MVITPKPDLGVAGRLYRAGFRDIIPVVPPGAKISRRSRLRPEQLGKVPGKRGIDGWSGFRHWSSHEATEADVAQWARWDPNVGLKAERFPAFDFDFESEDLTKLIEPRSLNALGPAPKRLSRGPRRLFVYRTDEPFRRMALRILQEERTHTLEVLGQGQQYLVHGTHPSGAIYRWAGRPLWEVTAEQLTCITEAETRGLLEQLRDELAALGIEATLRSGGSSAAGETPPQESLLAPSLEDLAALVGKMRNEYPTREEYIRFMLAVRAAGANEPVRALDIFQDWASRWDGGPRRRRS